MMTAVKAYYDGTNFVTLQDYKFKPHQQVLIVVDDDNQKETSQKKETSAEAFLKLSWAGNESAEEILNAIQSGRANVNFCLD